MSKTVYDILNLETSIIFTLHYNDLNDVSFRADKLFNILNRKYPQLKYKIFIFNNMYPKFYKYESPTIFYLNIPYRSPSLNESDFDNPHIINKLFIREMYNTPYGIEFGGKILPNLLKCMEDNKKYTMLRKYNFDMSIN